MAEGLISEYIDRKGIEEDTDFMLDRLNKILVKLKAITSFQGELAMSKTFGQATSAAAKLRKEIDETEKIQKEIDAQRAKRLALDNQLNKILVEEKELLRQRNQEVKNSIREQNAAEGSIEQLRATLIRLNKEYDNLSKAEREAAQGTELKASIKATSDELKKLEGETGRFQRNVGNYSQSAKIIVDALERVKLKVVDSEKQFGKMSPEAAAARHELEGLQRVTSNPQFLAVAGKVGDANAELRQFTRTLIELERAGLGNSDFANELRKNLAELQDQVQDTRQEIRAMASDSRAFDQLSSSVNFLASTYQTFVGIQALAGDQSEEVQETIKKLVAVQSIANGLQEISNQLTQRGTLVNKAFTFVQTQYTIATNASAAATTRLAAATKLIGIGLAVGAIAFIVSKLQEWGKAAKEVVSRQSVLNELSKAAAENYGSEKGKLDSLVATLKVEGLSRKEKFTIVKQLQDQFPGYFDGIKTEKDLTDKLAIAYQNAAQGILLKATAQAAADEIGKNSSKLLQSQISEQEELGALANLTQEQLRKNSANRSKFGAEQIKQLAVDFGKEQEAIKKRYADERNEIQKKNDFLVQAAIDAQQKLKKLGGVITPTDTKTPEKKDKDDALQKQLQAEFDLLRLQKERRIALNKEIADAEDGSLQERTTALGQYIKEQIQLIELEAEFEKSTKKLSATEIKVIEEDKQNKILAIVQEGTGKLKDIQDDYKKKVVKDNDDIELSYSSTYEKVHKIVTDAAKKQEEAIKKANELEKEGLEKKRDLIKQLADEIKELTFDLFTSGIEREKNQIQESINFLEEKRDKELEVIEQTSLSEKEKAERTANLEARTNAQRQAFARQQRQLDIEKAKFDKAKNIADAVQNAAVAIISAQKYPPPLNGILTALIAAIAAAQIARIITTPIPKYFRGKKANDPYEGLGIVGDGGKKELIKRKSGEVEITPNTPTLTYVYRGDVIEPDADALLRIAKKSTDRTMSKAANIFHVQPDTSTAKAIDRMGARVENAIKRMPQTNVQVQSIMKKWIRSNNSIDHYL